jgi:hypothetical protein
MVAYTERSGSGRRAAAAGGSPGGPQPASGVATHLAKIFISYSRKDAAFALRLVEHLTASGFDAFLDKTDIAPGEPWKDRLAALIAASDTVVFVVSSDSRDPTKQRHLAARPLDLLRQARRSLSRRRATRQQPSTCCGRGATSSPASLALRLTMPSGSAISLGSTVVMQSSIADVSIEGTSIGDGILPRCHGDASSGVANRALTDSALTLFRSA